MLLQLLSALAGIIGTIIAAIALIVSPDFRQFVIKLAKNRLVQLVLVMAIVFMAGLLIGTQVQLPVLGLGDDLWPPPNGILDAVTRRSHLRCGIDGGVPGFSIYRSPTDAEGFDADYCRAIAVAVFGDHVSRVEFKRLQVGERFLAVVNGDIDVLFRNTTWTVGRDLERPIEYGPVTFYDAQTFLVRRDSGIGKLDDLTGKRICVLPETTSIDNLRAALRLQGIEYEQVTASQEGKDFEVNSDTFGAFASGRCDAVTTDRSQLIANWQDLPNPGEYAILPDNISKEPLSPVFVAGDNQWRDIVNYSVYVTIQAAELDITSENIQNYLESPDISIREFLGIDDPRIRQHIGEALGVKKDYSQKIIARVGNYDEIYDNNLGVLIPDRGLNRVWSKGGLLYAPPFRTPDPVSPIPNP